MRERGREKEGHGVGKERGVALRRDKKNNKSKKAHQMMLEGEGGYDKGCGWWLTHWLQRENRKRGTDGLTITDLLCCASHSLILKLYLKQQERKQPKCAQWSASVPNSMVASRRVSTHTLASSCTMGTRDGWKLFPWRPGQYGTCSVISYTHPSQQRGREHASAQDVSLTTCCCFVLK